MTQGSVRLGFDKKQGAYYRSEVGFGVRSFLLSQYPVDGSGCVSVNIRFGIERKA